MNCDQAFDCLTDSSRRHSAELERHLAGCPRCRQMHDTLEPALDLFDEFVEEPDLSGLARDPRPMVSTESRQIAEQTAARLVATSGSRRRRGDWTGFVRYAGIFLCGALVVLVLGSAQQRFGHDSIQGPPQEGCTYGIQFQKNRDGRTVDAVVAACLNCHNGRGVPIPPGTMGIEADDGTQQQPMFEQVGRLYRRESELLALIPSPRAAGLTRFASAMVRPVPLRRELLPAVAGDEFALRLCINSGSRFSTIRGDHHQWRGNLPAHAATDNRLAQACLQSDVATHV